MNRQQRRLSATSSAAIARTGGAAPAAAKSPALPPDCPLNATDQYSLPVETCRNSMEPLRPGHAQRSALPSRPAADGTLGGAQPTRMYGTVLKLRARPTSCLQLCRYSRPSTARTGSSLTQAYLFDANDHGKMMVRAALANTI
jgi:hypothetical protein